MPDAYCISFTVRVFVHGMATPKTVETVQELIDFFGGPNATGAVLKTTPQAVINWRTRGQLPTKLHFVHRNILKQKGVNAPSSLWGFVEAA